MEQWKDVKGFEGKYAVSNIGNVKRLPHYKRCGKKGQTLLNEKAVKTYKNFKGYDMVMLSKNGKSYTKLVHKLVAEAFLPNDNAQLQVNHIDGNKTNNNVTNLEWVTGSENIIHAINMGLKKSTKVVIVETGEVFNSIRRCASHIGGSRAVIARRINEHSDKPYMGYHFKLCEEGEE